MDNRDNELAELQATIDRLTAENERLNTVNSDLLLGGEIVDKMCEEVMDERDQLKDEIERLKGGQGETVAEVVNHQSRDMCKVTVQNVKLLRSVPDGTKLYTSQPAPVSVVPGKDLRAQYETWADANGYDITRNEHGDYAGLVEDSMWSGWQAKAEHWVLPERIARGQSIEPDTKAIGWNACLDKVNELNQ
jgi:hypothetical protein